MGRYPLHSPTSLYPQKQEDMNMALLEATAAGLQCGVWIDTRCGGFGVRWVYTFPEMDPRDI